MTKYLNYSWFKIATLLFIIAETLALAAYALPVLNWLLLPILIIAAIWLVRKNSLWALYLPLAELVWGSLGKNFYWNFGHFEISLRLLLFVTIFIATLPAIIHSFKKINWRSPEALSLLAIALVIFVGLLNGWIRHNALSDIFLDANGYFFLGYFLVWFELVPKADWKKVSAIGLAGALVVALKTILVFYLFAHDFSWSNVTFLYLWVRDTKVGELTFVTGNVWRIFFQSQIYVVLAWLLWSFLLITDRPVRFTSRNFWLFAILGCAIILSLSRSLWVAIIITLAVVTILFWQQFLLGWKKSLLLLSSLLVAFIIIVACLFLPPVDANLAAAFNQRLAAGGQAVSARQNLLPVLLTGIKDNFLLGAGFGTQLTYKNTDPRVKNPLNPSGLYSTYSFELGWLAYAYKFGVIGGLIWLAVIGYQLVQGFRRGKARSSQIILAATMGLFLLAVTHLFTPYLDHPLGLGFLVLHQLALYHHA